MATATDEIYVKIIAETKDAIASIGDLAKGFLGAYVSVQTLKAVLVDSIKAFADAQDAEVRLGQSLRATGQYSIESANSLVKYAEALQNTSTFTHEAIQDASSLLISIAHLSKDGVEAIMPHLMDFSAAYGVDLTSAARMAASAMEGGRNQFIRYGIDIKDAHTPTERFNELIKALTGNVGGMSDALAKTAGGSLKQFKIQLDELKETAGGWLMQNVFTGVPFVNASIASAGIVGKIDVQKADVDTLKEYRKTLLEYLKGVHDFGTEGIGPGVKATEATLASINQQLQRMKNSAPPRGGVIVENALGPDPELALKYLKDAGDYLMYYQWGKRGPDKTASPALPMYGTGMEFPGGPPGGTSGTGQENTAMYQANIEWTRRLANEAQNVSNQWRDAGQQVAYFGSELGKAMATGNWEGAFRSITAHLADMLAQYAITAAAAAAASFDFPMALFWLGVAGAAAIGGGAIGASSSAGSQPNIPHYASGTDYVPQTGLAVVHQGEQIIPAGGRAASVVIHVHGGMWQSDDLARQVARAMGKW